MIVLSSLGWKGHNLGLQMISHRMLQPELHLSLLDGALLWRQVILG